MTEGRPSARVAALLALLLAVPLAAQPSPGSLPQFDYELEQRPDRDEHDSRYEEEQLQADIARGRPWTFGVWLPANWRSNLRLAERNPRGGITLDPEVSLARRWDSGRLHLFAEAGGFLAMNGPDPAQDVSGWWLTAEAMLGDQAAGWAPYLSYEPRALHEGVFGPELLTFHDLVLGLKRRRGGTSINLFVRRRDANVAIADRSFAGVHVTHVHPLSDRTRLNIRADGEYRRFDAVGGGRRVDWRGRVRTRLFVALDPAVDLVLGAELIRNQSNEPGFSHTVIIVGPTLSARLGF